MSTRVSSAAPAALVVLVAGHLVSLLSAQTVVTVAGGYAGDGGPATSAALSFPGYAVFDSPGNLLVTDINSNRIRKVDTAGNISTLAGNGLCGFTGDGGPASKAEICNPYGITIDSTGNIFFADSGNGRIRRISAAGIIQTVAGNGTFGFCGDGGQARNACLDVPQGIALNGTGANEVLFIADALNNRVRKVLLKAGTIVTVAGDGIAGSGGDGGLATSAQLDNPVSVAVDPAGQFLYISDQLNGKIRLVGLAAGTIETYFGKQGCGPDLNSLCSPQGITFDSKGNLYVADSGNGRILKLVTGSPVTIAAGGTSGFNGDGLAATSTWLHFPNSAVFDRHGTLLTLDSSNNRIRKGSGSQLVSTVAGGFLGDGKRGVMAALDGSFFDGLALDAQGNLFFADSYANRVRKILPNDVISTMAGTGITGDSGDGGPAKSATLSAPVAIAADSNGNIFIGDPGNFAIRKVDATGTITTLAILNSYGLATDSQGNIYSAGFFDCAISKITPLGAVTIVAGQQFLCGDSGDGGAATAAQLFDPIGVAVDKSGNIYIADWSNNRVRKVDSTGTISTLAGTGICSFDGDGGLAVAAAICQPLGVAVDQNQNVYIADTFNFRVRKVSAGIITTLAGTGRAGYNGDGLPALETNLFPVAIAAKPNGAVFVFDTTSQLVRKVQ